MGRENSEVLRFKQFPESLLYGLSFIHALRLRSISDKRQFLIHLKKYQKFCFLFFISVLPAAQGLKQIGILFLPNLGQ